METLALPLVITSVILAAGVILLRRYWLDFHLWISLGTIAAILLCIFLISLAIAKKRFETKNDALVRLDSAMGLHSSLSAAEAGHSGWPIVPNTIQAGIRWNYRRLFLPIIGSVSLIFAAFVVHVEAAIPPVAATAPRSWENLAADLEELKAKGIINSDYIKEMEDKLDELKNQPEKDWYSHPSLEATENITSMHEQAMNKLSRNLDKAEKSLSTLKKHSENLNQAQKNKLLNQFNNAMEAIEKGRMKPNKALLDKLKNIDPNMLNNLTPEQLEKIRENMKNMSDELKKQLRDGIKPTPGEGGEGDDGAREQPWDPNDPNGGEPGDGDGSGGNQRGPGHVPKVLGGEAQKLTPGEIEKLKSQNLKNSLPGDLLETSDGGEHKIDKSKSQQQGGGSTNNTGDGGDSVWKSNYLPKEKRALKKFFK